MCLSYCEQNILLDIDNNLYFPAQDDCSQMPSGITELVSAPLVSKEVCPHSALRVSAELIQMLNLIQPKLIH